MVKDLTENTVIFDEEGVCPTRVEPGDPRILVISGENAGGKSFFARMLASTLHQSKPSIEPMLWRGSHLLDRERFGPNRVGQT